MIWGINNASLVFVTIGLDKSIEPVWYQFIT